MEQKFLNDVRAVVHRKRKAIFARLLGEVTGGTAEHLPTERAMSGELLLAEPVTFYDDTPPVDVSVVLDGSNVWAVSDADTGRSNRVQVNDIVWHDVEFETKVNEQIDEAVAGLVNWGVQR